MRSCWLVIPVFLLSGCGPLMYPMPMRLDPQQQQEVDSAWNAMLTPVKRLDRQTLLDCIVMMQLYQSGVDKFSARSEKQTAAGKVEMSIDFDRSKPDRDRFTIRVVGPWGVTRRQERWSAKDIFDAYGLDKNGWPQSLAKDDSRNVKMQKRLERVQAATQPATQ